MTKTADTLRAMLTENTGTHMLDSGGAYGRSWQQNQGRDFEAEPAATISVEEGYIDIRRSTFHFLNECLEFDEAMTDRFYEFCKGEDNLLPWLLLMETFARTGGTGIYGEGDPVTANTYNHDSLVDQILQYTYFEIDEQGYVLLQIHGGCDARGGYTAPKAFRCNIEDSQSIFSDGDATITCKGGEHRWYVQEGDWDTDHEDAKETRGLDEFVIIDKQDFDEFPFADRPMLVSDKTWQDAEGVHCPLCGGILEVW